MWGWHLAPALGDQIFVIYYTGRSCKNEFSESGCTGKKGLATNMGQARPSLVD